MSEYRLNVGDKKQIAWGSRLGVEEQIRHPSTQAVKQSSEQDGLWEWDLPDGVYRAKDIVRELSILLEAICEQLGDAAKPEALLINIEASLAVSGRETTLPLGALAFHDKARTELTDQAVRIGAALARWARGFSSERLVLQQVGREILGKLIIRSRCDHHQWTHEVSDLLMGATGGPSVMQLFNEYLHQIVLLRDGLLPFENWEEVPIELKNRETRGLRYTEQAHAGFLSEFLAKPIAHKSLVRYAQSLLSPELTAVGYGFQYRLGTILPAGLGTSLSETPSYLLRWYPVRSVISKAHEEPNPVSFAYAYPDYYAAGRSHAGSGSFDRSEQNGNLADIGEAKLEVHENDEGAVTIEYRIRTNYEEYAVDLGQLFRGHRYLYRTKSDAKTGTANEPDPGDRVNPLQHLDARRILGLPGLVTNESGTFYIDAGKNELVQRALLGKLYPENVILLDHGNDEELNAARRSGKSFGAKFLIH